MAEQNDDSKGSRKTLHDSVNEWINNQGYPLEFRTARIFKKYGFYTEQGAHVIDGENAREIDVIASKVELSGLFSSIEYVIECKYIKDKPWIIFDSEDYTFLEIFNFTYALATNLSKAIFREINTTYAYSNSKMFEQPSGFTISAMKSQGGQDNSYSSIQSVCNNSLLQLAKHERSQNRNGFPTAATMVIPLIVVDGFLYRARYDASSNKMQASEIQSARILWNGSNKASMPILVEVVNINYLEAYINERVEEINFLISESKERGLNIHKYLHEYILLNKIPSDILKRKQKIDDLVRNFKRD